MGEAKRSDSSSKLLRQKGERKVPDKFTLASPCKMKTFTGTERVWGGGFRCPGGRKGNLAQSRKIFDLIEKGQSVSQIAELGHSSAFVACLSQFLTSQDKAKLKE